MDILLLLVKLSVRKILAWEVSILVLMDILLLLDSHLSAVGWQIFCFNPCFNGYTTFTYSIIRDNGRFIFVSILVLMDILLLLDTHLSIL